MKKLGSVFLATLFLSGCAVKYSPVQPQVERIDAPKVGEVATAQTGDHLLTKGALIQQEALNLKTGVDGWAYDIVAGVYPKLGFSEDEQFFSPSGVIRNPLADSFQSISVKNDKPDQVCVITVFAARVCYDADFKVESISTVAEASFQQTLIYSGRVGSKINIGYREFSSNTARPAFNNDVEYDLSTSNRIGYKGAELEIIQADNTGITYKVISTFK